jgi:ParB/RepB/Spo0J family partition protein
MMTETVEQVPISKIKAAPDNPRKDVGDISELAESMKSAGILQPIVVCERDGGYLVVYGARRLAAAALAGFKEVPVIVRDYDEPTRLIAMSIENLQREDLSPTEEAGAYQRLLDELKTSQRMLSSVVGKTQSHISKRLALLALPKDVQAKVDSGGITIPAALELAKLAEYPERLKAALNGPAYYDLDVRVRMELEAVEQEKAIVKLEQEMESKGLATVRVTNEYQLPKGVHRLKGGNAYDPHALQITPKQHETEPCHAIAITKKGLGFPVCTDRKQHPKVKTKQEADRGSSGGSGTAFRQPRETAEQKKLKQARERRLAFVAGLVAKKPPKEALTLALRYFVLEQLVAFEGDVCLDRAVIWLGLVDVPEDGSTLLPDDVDVDALVTEFIAQGEAQLHRAAVALAAAAIDSDGYNGVDAHLSGSALRGESLAVSAYLEFLRSQGCELDEAPSAAIAA